jgi:metal-dependent amidase/aminoacylase/carboxypeptidase family protein
LHYVALLPTGVVATRPDALMASADSFDVEITGYGGHGSAPHLAIDPIAAAAKRSSRSTRSSRAKPTRFNLPS